MVTDYQTAATQSGKDPRADEGKPNADLWREIRLNLVGGATITWLGDLSGGNHATGVDRAHGAAQEAMREWETQSDAWGARRRFTKDMMRMHARGRQYGSNT